MEKNCIMGKSRILLQNTLLKMFYGHEDASLGSCCLLTLYLILFSADDEVKSEHLKNMKGDKERLELVKADVLDYAAMLAAVDGMKVCSIQLALLLARSLTPRLASKTPKFNFHVKSQNRDL